MTTKAIKRRAYAVALRELRDAQKRAAISIERTAKEMKKYPGQAGMFLDALQSKVRSEKRAVAEASKRYKAARAAAIRACVKHPGDKYGGEI